MTLSFINDEYSENISECIHFCKKHNVHHIELRKINAQNILNIKDIDIEKIALLLSKNNIRVSCIASPFLKWDRKNNQTSSDFNFYKHKDDVYYLNKLIQIADIFSTNNIRIFSYIKSTDFDMSNFVDYLKRVDEFLEQKNKNFLLENEPICNISHIHHLYTLFHENKFKHIFPLIDLGNAYFLEEAIDRNELEFLKKSCFYYHIKDFNGEQKCYVPLGKGNINFFDLVIKKMRKDSFLSLETHTKKKEDVEISLNELRRITNA